MGQRIPITELRDDGMDAFLDSLPEFTQEDMDAMKGAFLDGEDEEAVCIDNDLTTAL